METRNWDSIEFDSAADVLSYLNKCLKQNKKEFITSNAWEIFDTAINFATSCAGLEHLLQIVAIVGG
jgi:ribulose bisphosphate carboxylase small subunit